MIPRPPSATRHDTLLPYTTLFRSDQFLVLDRLGSGRRVLHDEQHKRQHEHGEGGLEGRVAVLREGLVGCHRAFSCACGWFTAVVGLLFSKRSARRSNSSPQPAWSVRASPPSSTTVRRSSSG